MGSAALAAMLRSHPPAPKLREDTAMRVQMLALALTLGLTGTALGQAACSTSATYSRPDRLHPAGGAGCAAGAHARGGARARGRAPVPPPVPQQQTQQQTPPVPPSRFRFETAEDGYLRLDDRTGQVAFCSQHSAGWACKPCRKTARRWRRRSAANRMRSPVKKRRPRDRRTRSRASTSKSRGSKARSRACRPSWPT